MGARVGAAVRALRARTRRTLNRSVLQRLELARADSSDRPLEHAPLIVVGAPRSGSTLLYQLLVQRFDVTYLANRHCALFGAPSLVERLGGRRASPAADYSSKHGLTAGAWGPSECGPFWYRFFRKSPQHVTLADVAPDDLRRLRGAIRALGLAGARPLVFKNLLCALRLGPIAAALPEARFLVIRRELEEHARSILAARLRANGEVDSWWSVEPPGWQELQARPAAEQAVGQIEAIHSEIDDVRAQVGRSRFFDVSYSELIDDVDGTLLRLQAFAKREGIVLEDRASVPSSFPRPPAGRLSEELETALAEALARRGVAASAASALGRERSLR